MSDSKDDYTLSPENEDICLSPGTSGVDDTSFVESSPTRTLFGSFHADCQSNAPTSLKSTSADTSTNDLPLDPPQTQVDTLESDNTEDFTVPFKIRGVPNTLQGHGTEGDLELRKDIPKDLLLDGPKLHQIIPGPAGVEEPTDPREDPNPPQLPRIQGSEQDANSQSAAVDQAQQLCPINPLNLLSWTPNDFKKAQLEVVRQLEYRKSELDHQNATVAEAQRSEIDVLLRDWEVTRDVSAELYPSWEEFEKERRTYEARISNLEAEVEELSAGKEPGEPPHPEAPFRGDELEDTWLRKPHPETTDEWEAQIKAILCDVRAREEELEKQRREVMNYKNYLDHKKHELLTYNQRAVDDVASTARTANALLDTIRKLRGRVQEALNFRERNVRERYIEKMRKVDVFDETEELALKIVGKVRVAESNMVGFWEGNRGRGVRAPWELIRAIKARDQKTALLEDHVRELERRVAGFTRRMGKIRQAAKRITNIEDSQSAEGFETFADHMRALAQLISDELSESNYVSTEQRNNPRTLMSVRLGRNDDSTLILEEDEYGNVLKMEDKFNAMKAKLKGQMINLKHLNNSYKESRDQALELLQESRGTCQKLRHEIESTKAKYQGMMEDMKRDLGEYQTEVHQSHKALGKHTEKLQEKVAECEELKTEMKRLLAYNEDQAPADDEMNPIFKKLLDQTDKGRGEHNNEIDGLHHSIAQLEAKNASLELALAFEKRQLSVYMNAANRVPTLRGELEAVRKVADGYRHDFETAKSRAETLEYELQVEKSRGFNLEGDKPRLEREVLQLESELEDRREETDKLLADKKELEAEITNLREDTANYRKAFEDLSQHGKLRDQDGEAATTKPNPFLTSALSQRISLLHQLRDLRAKYHDLLSKHNKAVVQKRESQHKLYLGREELSLETETERRLRDDLATAYNENNNLQKELSHLKCEIQRLELERKEHDENDPSKIWDDTPAGIPDGFLKSRIKALEEDLAKAREAGSASRGLKNDAENPDPAEIKSCEELFCTVQEIYGVPSPPGSTELSLSRADMTNFWLHGTLLRKRLALLQAIKDGDNIRGNEVLIELDKLLLDTDLGPARDEAWGSAQCLRACFHLYATRDLAAAEEAIWRAGKHHPGRWTNGLYRDLGAKLKADLTTELESRIYSAGVGSAYSIVEQ